MPNEADKFLRATRGPETAAMVVEYIRYKIAQNNADQFIADYAAAAGSLDKSPHCQGYELSRCVEEPTSFILRIVWTSVSDHMTGFRKSAEFAHFFASIKPYLTSIEEMRHYELTKVVK